MSRIYYFMTDYNCHYLDLMTYNNCYYLYLWQIITVVIYILWQQISVIINLVWQILNVIIYHLWHLLLTVIISLTIILINYQENVFDDSFFLDSNVIIVFSIHAFLALFFIESLFLLSSYHYTDQYNHKVL